MKKQTSISYEPYSNEKLQLRYSIQSTVVGIAVTLFITLATIIFLIWMGAIAAVPMLRPCIIVAFFGCVIVLLLYIHYNKLRNKLDYFEEFDVTDSDSDSEYFYD